MFIKCIIMEYNFDYTFNNNTRIGDDSCDLSQRNIQNVGAANYMLTNFRPNCPMNDTVAFATSQPNINFTGSHQVGINGCNINENSELHITDITKPKCRISLYQRPFLTVPYLGRGQSNPVLESQLQQGELANNRKTINPSSEVSYMNYSCTPMLPTLKASITNPANLVEDAAADGWVRGGVPTRELIRDNEYKNNQYS